MIEAFECHEDGHSMIWFELFKMYPEDFKSMKIFPYANFIIIWNNLTFS